MRSLLFVLALTVPAVAAHAQPTDAVRGYFQALDHQDFGRAIALTDGAAQERTSRMVARLKSEAAAHNARVEVKVKQLAVQSPGAPCAQGVPVPVAFHIDVVGHKYCFSKVARKLEGEARFYVDPAHPDRIIAIEGQLDE